MIRKLLLLSLIIPVIFLSGCTNSNSNKVNENKMEKLNSNPVAVFDTSVGSFEIELFKDLSPKTVDNFVKLANDGFYDGIKFHRVIKDFMIQGGDPLTKDDSMKDYWGTGGPGYKFDDEINNEVIVKGSFAMANAGSNTNGSQFFIVTAEATPWLDGKHTNFGKVIKGMDIVMNIENVQTNEMDRPLTDVVINSVKIK